MTVRRKEGVGRFEIGAFVVASSIVVLGVALGMNALNDPAPRDPGSSAGPAFVFAAIAALAATGDLRMIVRGGISGARRIARHLWRMCVALFVAAGSLFLGQQQVFPASMRGSLILFLPEIAIVGLLIFWMVRVRVGKRFKSPATASADIALDMTGVTANE